MALALPSSAGDNGHLLDADVTPEVVAPGETVTVSSVDPCPAGTSGPPFWTFENLDTGDGWEGDHIPLEEDGSWSVSFEAPAELGEYVFETSCQPPEECFEFQPEALKTETAQPELDCSEHYYVEFFTVEEGSTTPTTSPTPTTAPPTTTPPPATPIVRPPTDAG